MAWSSSLPVCVMDYRLFGAHMQGSIIMLTCLRNLPRADSVTPEEPPVRLVVSAIPLKHSVGGEQYVKRRRTVVAAVALPARAVSKGACGAHAPCCAHKIAGH